MSDTPDTVQPTAPAAKQVMIRTTEETHERWKTAAEHDGISLNQWLIDVANRAAASVLDCTHPLDYRKRYAWANICRKCGKRLPLDA